MRDENFRVFEQVQDLQHDESSVEEILGRLDLLPRATFEIYVELRYEQQCVFQHYCHRKQCYQSWKMFVKIILDSI